jgi:hypothetical protein
MALRRASPRLDPQIGRSTFEINSSLKLGKSFHTGGAGGRRYRLASLVPKIMQRSVSVFTGWGLQMLLLAAAASPKLTWIMGF